jgi:hypothetical protein
MVFDPARSNLSQPLRLHYAIEHFPKRHFLYCCRFCIVRRRSALDRRAFAVRSPMSQLGQSRHFDRAPLTSGLPLMNGHLQNRSACLKAIRAKVKVNTAFLVGERYGRLSTPFLRTWRMSGFYEQLRIRFYIHQNFPGDDFGLSKIKVMQACVNKLQYFIVRHIGAFAVLKYHHSDTDAFTPIRGPA